MKSLTNKMSENIELFVVKEVLKKVMPRLDSKASKDMLTPSLNTLQMGICIGIIRIAQACDAFRFEGKFLHSIAYNSINMSRIATNYISRSI